MGESVGFFDFVENRLARWPRHSQCHRCRVSGRYVRATVRVFAGCGAYAMSAGGEAACDEHADRVVERYLVDMVTHRPKLPDRWSVVAYRVESDEDGWPTLREKLFAARQRSDAPVTR